MEEVPAVFKTNNPGKMKKKAMKQLEAESIHDQVLILGEEGGCQVEILFNMNGSFLSQDVSKYRRYIFSFTQYE